MYSLWYLGLNNKTIKYIFQIQNYTVICHITAILVNNGPYVQHWFLKIIMKLENSYCHKLLGEKLLEFKLCKNTWAMRFREAPGGWRHLHAIRVTCREGAGRLSVVPKPLFLARCFFSICLILSCTLYNTMVNISKVSSRVLWAVLTNYQTWGWVMGIFNIACRSEAEVVWYLDYYLK